MDFAAATAWCEGRLAFDGATLAEVVRELARYSAHSAIRLADEEVGKLRLSGSFSANDPQALLGALPCIPPLRVRNLPDGSAEIRRRRGHPLARPAYQPESDRGEMMIERKSKPDPRAPLNDKMTKLVASTAESLRRSGRRKYSQACSRSRS